MTFYKDKGRVELVVGIFSIIAVISLVLGYSWLTDMLQSHKYTAYRVRFDNAGNIEKGSPVTVRGVTRGKVDNLQITSQGVVMDILVELDAPLLQGTVFQIKEVDIMGDTVLEIVPGREAEELSHTAILQGEHNYSIANLIAQSSRLFQEVQEKLTRLNEEGDLFTQIYAIADTTQRIVSDLNQMMQKNDTRIDGILAHTETTMSEMADFLSSNREIADSAMVSMQQVFGEVALSLEEITQSVKNIRTVSDKMANEESSFQRLISEEDLYDNLLRASSRMDSLLVDIKDNPERYFKIKVF
jgi:phospholipid/cholesterol/gamma-HCH transport system substrate-binding protein